MVSVWILLHILSLYVWVGVAVDVSSNLHRPCAYLFVSLSSVQFDGRKVVSGAYDYLVKVWDPKTLSCLHTLQGHTNRVYSLQVCACVEYVSENLCVCVCVCVLVCWCVYARMCMHICLSALCDTCVTHDTIRLLLCAV